MPVTIKEIAERAGVSRQTVSYVLNDRLEMFSTQTREKVLKVGRELGYRPNSLAKAMRSQRFNAVGLILSDQPYTSFTPIELMEGIFKSLQQSDAHLVVAQYSDEVLKSQDQVPKLLRELTVDGLLINYNRHNFDDLRNVVTQYHIPSIWINAGLDEDCVGPDDVQIGRIAAEELLRQGHRAIAYVDLEHDRQVVLSRGETAHQGFADRYRGYQEAMSAAGLAPRPILAARPVKAGERPDIDPSVFVNGLDAPSAIILHSNYGLLKIWRAVTQAKRKLGVCTIGIDAQYLDDVPLTTVIVDERQIGQAAADRLQEKIAKPMHALKSINVPCSLIRGVAFLPIN